MNGQVSIDRKRVLVVEDEALVAMLIDDTLADHGFEVVGPASDVAQALGYLENGHLDGAVLDVNLGGGHTSYPVANELVARGIPFLFLSGYGTVGLDKDYAAHPLLQKPFDPARLVQMISEQLRDNGVIKAE